LNEEWFDSLDDARRKFALWRYDDNHVRPHSSLGNKTPTEARRALEHLEGSAHDALPKQKPRNMKSKPGNSCYEGGSLGGQVTPKSQWIPLRLETNAQGKGVNIVKLIAGFYDTGVSLI
jgi:hypothetical protein